MCSVVGCDSWRRKSRRFSLPEDPVKRLEWVQFVLEVNNQRLKESSCTDISVCSEHFTRDCFINPTASSATVQLKSGAVPTVCVKEESEEELELKQEPLEIEAAARCCEKLQRSESAAPIIEKGSSLTGAPANFGSNDYPDSSAPEIVQMLQKIKNLDIIQEKAALLQKGKRYVVNEKQLLQLFNSKCPWCQAKVKAEKVVHRVHVGLNLKCFQCDYRKEWKNLAKAGIAAAGEADVAECTEMSLESGDGESKSASLSETEEMLEESDVSSDPEEVNSDDDWLPEGEELLYNQLSDDTDEESSYEEDDDIPKDSLCTDCGAFYYRRKRHTCEHKAKPYSCNICGKRFVSEAALSSHSRVHDESYQHPCKYCHVPFKTKTDKITHELTHSTEKKPYRCSFCSETFAHHRGRRIHMRAHRGPELGKCHFCGLEFTRMLALQRHLLVHTGEKPYKCSVCERGFNQGSHLKSHMRLHTGERPYKCQLCDKRFNHNVSLKSHVQRYHKPNSAGGADRSKGDDTEAELDDAEEERHTDEEPQMKKPHSCRHKNLCTGRPVGRPKKPAAGKVRDSDTKSVRARKSKRSSEESEQFSDSVEWEEEGRSGQGSRRRPKGSKSDSVSEPETKTRRRGSGGHRGRRRRKSEVIEES